MKLFGKNIKIGPETKSALTKFGIAFGAALLIVLVGSSPQPAVNWLILLLCPALTAGGAFLATKGSDKKTRKSTILRWGILGLLFGVGAYFSI